MHSILFVRKLHNNDGMSPSLKKLAHFLNWLSSSGFFCHVVTEDIVGSGVSEDKVREVQNSFLSWYHPPGQNLYHDKIFPWKRLKKIASAKTRSF